MTEGQLNPACDGVAGCSHREGAVLAGTYLGASSIAPGDSFKVYVAGFTELKHDVLTVNSVSGSNPTTEGVQWPSIAAAGGPGLARACRNERAYQKQDADSYEDYKRFA